MIQSIDLKDVELTNFNNNEVSLLQLNGVNIWTDTAKLYLSVKRATNLYDTTIDEVTYPSGGLSVVGVKITSGNTETTATYGGITKLVAPNTTMTCIWGKLGEVDDGTATEGVLIIEGGFVHIQSFSYVAGTTTYYMGNITEVLQWTKGSQLSSTENMFRGQTMMTGIVNVPEGIKNLDMHAFNSVGFAPQLSVYPTVNLPQSLEVLSDNCFKGAICQPLEIPSGVHTIGSLSLDCGMDLIFMQPKDMVINLPTAGDSTGIAYNKNARTKNIYTDNLAIKNYNWSADNVTATFYHLDGTLWE